MATHMHFHVTRHDTIVFWVIMAFLGIAAVTYAAYVSYWAGYGMPRSDQMARVQMNDQAISNPTTTQ